MLVHEGKSHLDKVHSHLDGSLRYGKEQGAGQAIVVRLFLWQDGA